MRRRSRGSWLGREVEVLRIRQPVVFGVLGAGEDSNELAGPRHVRRPKCRRVGFTASVNAEGTVLTIHQVSTNLDVLRISLSNTTDGSYTVTQLNPISHPAGGDENNLQFSINYVVTDGNGDTATGSFSIDVDDDTPIATAGTSIGTVDEDGVVEGMADDGPGDGIAGGTGDVAGESVSATGTVSALFQSGADEPLTYGFTGNAITTLQALGLTSGGVALSYAIAADTVTASVPAGDGLHVHADRGGDVDIHAG